MRNPESVFPANKPYNAILSALKADERLKNIVGERITMNPPQKFVFPLIFCHIVGYTMRDITDDRKVVAFDDNLRIRVMAPQTWTRGQMEEVSNIIEEILMEFFQEKIGDITVFNINPTNSGIFFDSDTNHEYKSLEYSYDIVYG